MISRKDTAWKKSRKFGDVKGRRLRPKLADNLFARAHSLSRPDAGCELPMFITDNPSRDYFFPINEHDVRQALADLPRSDWQEITHIWFRRFKKSEYEADELPLAEFSCGSGVRLITLYPWPRSLEWFHGAKKPSQSMQRLLERYEAKLTVRSGHWVSTWTEAALKDFYIEHLLFHEIGHHVDWFVRQWSKANIRAQEEAADQYAFSKTTKRSEVYREERQK